MKVKHKKNKYSITKLTEAEALILLCTLAEAHEKPVHTYMRTSSRIINDSISEIDVCDTLNYIHYKLAHRLERRGVI